jgi:hypothetical protein
MVLVMESNRLHQLWKLIENNESSLIFKLDDQSLVQWLTQQLREKQSLSNEESAEARAYIQSKLLLIREIA